jgi:2-polyprenyl-3-methyl-5-hydroxy-6-metoxy-1,4-benzoquinol methylase
MLVELREMTEPPLIYQKRDPQDYARIAQTSTIMITRDAAIMNRERELTSKIEPFDSFWEAPDDIEKGYYSFAEFYKDNYNSRFPASKDARILCVSCGPGYLVSLLSELGYSDVTGIDSFPDKVAYATARQLNCKVAYAFDYIQRSDVASFDLIFCEQELNHLSKDEMIDFLMLCKSRLKPGGRFVCFALNGANPITGAEALAQNFDHQNTFTEYSLRQILSHVGFVDVEVFGLNLYVFYRNPLNYVAMAIAWVFSAFFRASYILYGKKNKIFTKKIGGTCRAPG